MNTTNVQMVKAVCTFLFLMVFAITLLLSIKIHEHQ